MLLTVDVGNTQTHIGVFAGSDLVNHWRIATLRESTGDELGVVLRNLFELSNLKLKGITGSIVSSTVSELRPAWAQMAKRYTDHEMLVVGPGIKTAVSIRIDNPRELGPDRLVNAVAAFARFNATCIVVDFGTAITFDAVSHEGDYLGGVIAPGVEISLAALSEKAAAISNIQIESPTTVIGKSTEQAVRSGVILGFAGLVDGIVKRMRSELAATDTALSQSTTRVDGKPILADEIHVIATGGYAQNIVGHCTEVTEIDDRLTLSGLRLIWERNQ